VTDLLVLGSGIAGLSAAIRAARAGLSVGVVTKSELATSATRYAQGGVAAALDEPDSTELHQTDTLLAGAGLCDVDAVHVLVTEGPRRVRELMELGAEFDTRDGVLELAIEGGHSLPRVVHAGGDATGAEIERALADAAHALASIDVHDLGGEVLTVIGPEPDHEHLVESEGTDVTSTHTGFAIAFTACVVIFK